MNIVVLSGGGLWAAAGIGMVEALVEMGVPIDGYVGSSAGAVVGALFALGYTPERLRHLAMSFRAADVRLDWLGWVRSLLQGRWPLAFLRVPPLFARLDPYLANRSWSSLIRPLWVVTTSLTRRQALVFGSAAPSRYEAGGRFHLAWGQQGLDLQTALRASLAVPGLFPPVTDSGDWLVDGGVADDYPVDVAFWVGATHIIGLWIDEKAEWAMPPRGHVGHVVEAGLTTMLRELSVVRQRQVPVPRTDIRLEMEGGHRVFDRVADIIDWGYTATRQRNREILAAVDRRA
ncbi:MAG: patatin-like phospholipase family protein [Firmicutes bacterium]|nr:patatin-like phospholipase family protein [Bacillota bacterium]